MDNNNILIPEYLKQALNGSNYENGYMLFHRFFDSREKFPDKKNPNYLKNFEITNTINTSMNNANATYINISNLDEILKIIPGQKYKSFDLKLTGAMVLGLGQPSVAETSMTIHPIYGVPFIPGQAVKGLVRSYYIQEYFDNDEKKANKDKIFSLVFGREDIDEKQVALKGNVVFYDAFIKGKFQLYSDIMNCHNSKYYQSGNPISDTENPIPIKFHVIRDATFHFGYAGRINSELSDEIIKKLETDLRDALTNYGVGAKTAVGYGQFTVVNQT